VKEPECAATKRIIVAASVEHLLAIDVEPLAEGRNVDLTWYVGLDAQGTRIGDALWKGENLDEAMRPSSFRLDVCRLDD
jgi:hypothetical protein